jgi:hypothetical protein
VTLPFAAVLALSAAVALGALNLPLSSFGRRKPAIVAAHLACALAGAAALAAAPFGGGLDSDARRLAAIALPLIAGALASGAWASRASGPVAKQLALMTHFMAAIAGYFVVLSLRAA